MRGCLNVFAVFPVCHRFPESLAAVRTTTYVSEEVCAPGISTLAALYARDTVPAGVCTPGPGSTVQTPSQTTLPVRKALVTVFGHRTNPLQDMPSSAHSPALYASDLVAEGLCTLGLSALAALYTRPPAATIHVYPAFRSQSFSLKGILYGL